MRSHHQSCHLSYDQSQSGRMYVTTTADRKKTGDWSYAHKNPQKSCDPIIVRSHVTEDATRYEINQTHGGSMRIATGSVSLSLSLTLCVCVLFSVR